MSSAPVVRPVGEVVAHRISPTDTVRLAVLSGPAQGSSTTVVFEIWEPGGSQPPNSHPSATETFVVLAGRGTAHSDDHPATSGPVTCWCCRPVRCTGSSTPPATSGFTRSR